MGKLADYMAMKHARTSGFEPELRAVRDLLHGVTHLCGSEHTIDLTATDGLVAGGAARAAFAEALRISLHEALVKYAHDLAREALANGVEQRIIGLALSGAAVAQAQPAEAEPEADAAESLAAA